MKRKFTKLLAALGLLVFMMPSMVGWGQTEVTFVAGTDTGETSVTKDGITVSMSTMSRTDNYRCYSGEDMTVSCESGKTISSIVLTCTGSNNNNYGPGKFSLKTGYSGNYSYSGTTGTWSGGAGEIKLTASAQVRMTQIVVTYTSSGGTPTCATPTFSPAAGAVTTGTEVTISCTTEGVAIYYTMGANPADPTTSSDEYDPDDKPIITAATTIKAIAVKENYNNSEVATASYTIKTPVPGYAIDFESDLDCYVDWEFTNALIHSGITGVSAHGGSAWATNGNSNGNATNTASFQTKNKVEYPDVFTCYVSKESGNTTSSNWKVQVSDDASSWTDVATQSAVSMDKGEWVEFSVSIKNAGYTNKYVRLYYSNSNAFRAVDDICLTTYTPAAVEEPSITVTSPFTISTSVSITCVTDGATIYYTTDGTDPTSSSTEYTAPFDITATTTIKAIAIKGSDESTIASVIATKELAEPTVTINASGITNTNVFTGTAAGSLAATVTYNNAAITGATVTWSGNNDEVATINSSTGAVTLLAAGSVTFTASYAGNSDYSAKTATYEMTVINTDPSTPGTSTTPYTVAQAIANTPSSGTSANVYIHGIVSAFYGSNTNITSDTYHRYYISDDGTTTTQLLVFNGKGLNNAAFSNANDLLVGDEVTICGGLTTYQGTKEIAANNYIVSLSRKVATPTFSPVAGAVVSGTTVTISTTTSDATIYYTTDGTEPTTSSTVYSAAITITGNTTLKAFAVKDGYTDSDVATATYTVATQVATPTFSLAEGTYTTIQTVTISCATEGATIYYTTDGTDPTTTSTAYAGAIAVNSTMTIKAIAAKEGMVNSEVASASYTIDIDYTILPFVWAGGTSAALTALNGVSAYGLGSDYAAQNAPYRVKMDGVGDYIQIKTDVQPTMVRIGVKMLGGGTTSKIKVQESADGSNFSDVEELTIEGSQNDILNLETTGFADATRYVRVIKSVHANGGNIGVGPIQIAKYASFDKVIAGYGTGSDKWYLIASPVVTAPTDVTNMLVGDNSNPVYDLYYFDQTKEDAEWCNYRVNTFNLEPGQGYLYARKEGTTLTFSGSYFGNGVVDLSYDANADFKGWNLIGNPFATAATLDMPFYKMNDAGDGFTTKIEDLTNTISAMEGVFVQATAVNQTATFTAQTSKGGRQSGIAKANLNVIGANGTVIDNAIVRFDEGQTLEKFMLHADGTKIFFTEDHKDYAIVRSNGQGQLPVNFKAAENGTYTIDVEAENLEVNYLHLIDNLTGMDVDLLTTPSYTFEARKSDIASRFRLVFDANTGNDETNDNFAFINNGELIVNGNGTVQVIDILGRQMFSHEVNSSFRIQNSSFAPGVYVLRLVNGNDVKTQKIVIK